MKLQQGSDDLLNHCSDPEIPTFFRGRSVFITGGTGFMGKVLVERLLSTCPGIKRLYLLIREKKGVSPEKRLQQIKQSQVFDMLRAKNPVQLDKMLAIAGDITKKHLGLTSTARTLLSEISIVFHSAATVKLQEELKLSVEQNLRSVIMLLELCDTLPKIDAFVQVSTAYSNAELPRVEEKVYPPPIEVQKLLDMVDDANIDQEVINKLIAQKPNTYTFSKAMAEHVIEKHDCKRFPVAIFKPTIVISSLQHPFPGWIENLNGPSGVIAGTSSGLLRVFRARAGAKADMIPVDMAIDTLIAVAWETALDKPSKARVYHCSTGENPTTWREFTDVLNAVVPIYPSSCAVLYPHLQLVKNRYVHRILENVQQTIPLYILECIKRIFCIKFGRNFIKANRNLKAMNEALEYFALREWIFENENTKKLRNRLSDNDRHLFNLDPNTINWKKLFTNFNKGTRTYVMRENDRDLEAVRTRIRMFGIIQTFTKILFTLITFKLISRCLLVRRIICQLHYTCNSRVFQNEEVIKDLNKFYLQSIFM